MKKAICILIIGLFALSLAQAQAPEKLTNRSIIKMTRANLSDDIIIDEITSSAVNFNLCADSVNVLVNARVSQQVIQAMKLAGGSQTANPETVPVLTPASSVPVVNPIQAPKEMSKKTDTVSVDSTQKTIIKDTAKPDTISKDSTHTVPNLSTAVKIAEPITPAGANLINKVENTTRDSIQLKDSIQQKDSIQINALVYVAPVNELVLFLKQEFENFNGTLTGWDRQIRDSLVVASLLKHMIGEVEKDLNTLKNADSKGYSQDIVLLKKTLADYRTKYKLLKTNIMLGGTKINKELKNISSDKIHSTGNKFNDVAQLVSSTNSNPANGENAVPVIFIKHKINDQIIGFVSPANGLLVWYQNEYKVLQGIIVNWNSKITPLLMKDTDMANKIKSLKSKLEEYKQNSKKYKIEISTLKKQISTIEKERKQLFTQMDLDKKQLATYLNQHKVEVQNSLLERLNDIIDDISYNYQEKLAL